MVKQGKSRRNLETSRSSKHTFPSFRETRIVIETSESPETRGGRTERKNRQPNNRSNPLQFIHDEWDESMKLGTRDSIKLCEYFNLSFTNIKSIGHNY